MYFCDQVQEAIAKARRRSPSVAGRMCSAKLINERGGLPWAPGDRPRSDEMRVREISVQMAQLGELVGWDPLLANGVLWGHIHIHSAVMIMMHERGWYKNEFGRIRYRADAWVQERLKPREGVRR